MNSKYKIVYSGSLKAGTDPEQFVQRFMEVFKVPEANARKLVGFGQAVTLKTKLERLQADKMREVMEGLGMVVHVEAMAESPAPTGPSGPAPGMASRPRTEAGSEGPRCPKCGSTRISGDDCLACGIIIPKYREKQARLAAEAAAQPVTNPYATPQSDVAPVSGGDQTELTGPHTVSAGNAWGWITEAWALFKQNPFAWIGAMLVWMVLIIIMSVIPFVGSLAVNILGPVFSAGFMLGANEQHEGGNFEVRHLFAGFSNFGSLALVGVLYLAGIFAIFVVAGMVFGGTFLAMIGGGTPQPADIEQMGMAIIGFVLLVFALMMPLLMAYWFAPALVALAGFTPFNAMKTSFVACLKNWLPFLIYGLLLLVLAIVALIPFGLGMLVLVPVVVATVFTSYRDIFYRTDTA